jgi:lipoyl(octanoyl) transferase
MSEKPAKKLHIRELGRQSYEPVWQAMQAYTATRDESSPDEFWLLEHDPVFTQGQAGKAEHLLNTGNIPVVQVDRGGQVTYHGPGQLVGYVLVDIRRSDVGVRELVTAIEAAIVQTLATFGLESAPRKDAPGVYRPDGAKIAQLGLRVRRGCSFHGLSLNVDMDLSVFQRINPCGHIGMAVTDIHQELLKEQGLQETAQASDIQVPSLQELGEILASALSRNLAYDQTVLIADKRLPEFDHE